MPRLIRQGAFETNSSSAHSLVISKENNNPVQNRNINIIISSDDDIFTGEPCNARKYYSVEDKIKYVVRSIAEHFQTLNQVYSIKFDADSEEYKYFKQRYRKSGIYNRLEGMAVLTKESLIVSYTTSTLSYQGYKLLEGILSKLKSDFNLGVNIAYPSESNVELGIAKDNSRISSAGDWKYFADTYIHTMKLPFSNNGEYLELSVFDYLNIEFPLKAQYLFDLDFICRFITNPDSYIRIGTDNGGSPLDPDLFKVDEHYITFETDPEETKRVLSSYDIIYNGSKAILPDGYSIVKFDNSY